MAKGKKTGGRRPGSKNKTTAALKDMILGALSDAGGQEYLTGLALSHPGVFCSLVGKVLPTEVTGKDGDDIRQTVTVVVKRDREFFGRSPVARAIAASDTDSGEPGAIQNGRVRSAVGENGAGPHGSG